MAGKNGFTHSCEEEKVSKITNKKALSDSNYSYAQIDMIWDFYVTHALCGGSNLSRTWSDYGWENTNNQKTGYGAIEKELLSSKYFEKICFIRSSRCKDTLDAMDLSTERFCAAHERAVLLQNYQIDVDENENFKFLSNEKAESKLCSLFRHIRNAFAHANTYFFDNGMVLLEDKEGKNKPTAAILIKQQTLLDWIEFIDKEEQYYILTDVRDDGEAEDEECHD